MPDAAEEPITAFAERLTTKDRRDEYGHPYEDFAKIAALWTVLLNVAVTREQVALCMISLKMARLCHNPLHRDSMIDIAGYANCLDLIRQRVLVLKSKTEETADVLPHYTPR